MLRQRLDLNRRTVLLTGGASGIGAAAARILVARGARVALVDLDEPGLQAMATELGPAVLPIVGSVTDRARLGEIVDEVLAWSGSIDVVWANAGIAADPPTTIALIDEAEFERIIEIDLLGVWRTIRAALPAVRAANGHVLITSSCYAYGNGLVNAPYAASKAAVESLGRSLRAELAGTGTTAGVLYPGWIETPIVHVSRHADPIATQLTAIGYPGPLGRLIPAPELAERAIAGIERRAARTIHPKVYVAWSVLRGVLNPIIDAGIDRHRKVQRLVRELEESRQRP